MLIYGILYFLTIYFPLRMRDIYVNILARFFGKNYSIDLSYRLLNGKSLLGILPDGSFLVFPLDDMKLLDIISEVYSKKIYDLQKFDKPDLICDLGAHIGLFSLRMAKLVSDSKIIAVEVSPSNYSFCLRNITLNKLCDRVEVFCVAVGQNRRTAILYLNKFSRGDNSLRKEWHGLDISKYGWQRKSVNVLPLEDILPIETSHAFLKIDVEGMETEVLKGLENRSMVVDRFVIEIHTSITEELEVYKWLNIHSFSITKKQRLYSDCLIIEARRH